jgi:hypothetical protein
MLFSPGIRTDQTLHIIPKKLDQIGTHSIRGIIPTIPSSQQKTCPWKSHIEVRISGSARIKFFLAAIPLAQEKHREPSGINNEEWVLASRRWYQFLEATE